MDANQPRARRKTSSSSPMVETKININSNGRPHSVNSNSTIVSTPPTSSSTSSGHHSRITSSCYRSFSNSSSPICRICHETDTKEELVSPCYCSGTMGLVHVSCMERWLSSTSSDTCELCHYKFKTYKTPKSCFQWLRDTSSRGRHQRSLVGDGVCFALLTPLAVVSGFLCIEGAHQQVLDGNRMEAGCLVALSSILAVVYFLWTALTFRFYFRHWRQWQLTNHNIKIVYVKHVTGTRPSPVNNLFPEPLQVDISAIAAGSPEVVLHRVGSDEEENLQTTPVSHVDSFEFRPEVVFESPEVRGELHQDLSLETPV